MQLLLSFILVYGGIAVYFVLLRFGIYRLYPIEMYLLILGGVLIAFVAAGRRPSWGRYAIAGMHGAVFLLMLGWTLLYSRLPVRPLPVTVGQAMPVFSLTDQDGRAFSTDSQRGKVAALYVFYRGHW
jgi:hypothetical protein